MGWYLLDWICMYEYGQDEDDMEYKGQVTSGIWLVLLRKGLACDMSWATFLG